LARLLPPVVRLKSDTTGENSVRPKADTPDKGGSVRLQPDRELAIHSDRELAILDYLGSCGASFFGPLHEAVGGGYPAETVDGLWNLVWQGVVTNHTVHALPAVTPAPAPRPPPKTLRRPDVSAFRSRRLAPPSAEGRWALVARGRREPSATRQRGPDPRTTTWAAAVTQQLLARHGVLTREAIAAESVPGGFGVVYPVLK